MAAILHRFKINLPDYKHGVLFAELDTNISNNRFAKTFFDGIDLKVEYISLQEYASALAHIELRIIPTPE